MFRQGDKEVSESIDMRAQCCGGAGLSHRRPPDSSRSKYSSCLQWSHFKIIVTTSQ